MDGYSDDTNKPAQAPAQAPAGFDIANLDTRAASNSGAELELRHPTTNVPIGVFITLLGKHSDQFREHMQSQVNARLRRESNASKRGKQNEPTTAQQIEADAVEALTASTIGWRNMTYKGAPLEFSVPNCLMIYSEQIWLREQVDEFIGDLENFMKV